MLLLNLAAYVIVLRGYIGTYMLSSKFASMYQCLGTKYLFVYERKTDILKAMPIYKCSRQGRGARLTGACFEAFLLIYLAGLKIWQALKTIVNQLK